MRKYPQYEALAPKSINVYRIDLGHTNATALFSVSLAASHAARCSVSQSSSRTAPFRATLYVHFVPASSVSRSACRASTTVASRGKDFRIQFTP